MRFLLCFTWLLINFCYCHLAAALDDSACDPLKSSRMVSLQGDVQVDVFNTGNWKPVSLNQVICEGSIISVKSYSNASLDLPNGVTLRIDADTILTLKDVNPEKPALLDIVRGFIYFLSRTPKQLTITTPIANAGPEGTEFAIRTDQTKTEVWVYEGKVNLSNNFGQVKIDSGQYASANSKATPTLRIDLNPNDAVKWALYYPRLLPVNAENLTQELKEAALFYKQGRIDLALLKLDSSPLERQNLIFLKTRAALRLINGRIDLANQDLQRILEQQQNSPEAFALLSIIALSQNQKEKAKELVKKALAFGPKSVVALSASSYIYQADFDLENALAMSKKALLLEPQDALLWARRAELEEENGLTDDSLSSAKKALELDPKLERTQVVMGFINLGRIDLDEALSNFEAALRFDSTSPLARFGLGITKIRKGQLENGRKEIEIAAVLDPNNGIIRSYLGKAYYEEKREALASAQYDLAKAYDPKDPTPYFYSAIKKQSANQPVQAVEDMQKAIELNDNRAVYRSRFNLDKDIASRQVGLGRIYNSLGFKDVANRLAAQSTFDDPSNYSAHRFLSDSYANEPRQEIARSSEYLQSLLLQPINYNPIQPSLAYIDTNILRGIGPASVSFNEYNRLFERNGIRFTSTGLAGSYNTFGDEAALAGILNKFSFSIGQLHYKTDGFRPNNDLKNDLYNVFAQYELLPTLNVQLEYRNRNTRHGDIFLNGDSFTHDSFFRKNIFQNTYRVGLKYSPQINSDFLVSYHRINQESEILGKNYRDQLNTDGNDFEAQHLYRRDSFNWVLGGGIYKAKHQDIYTDISTLYGVNTSDGITHYHIKQNYAYLYSYFKIFKNINITLGLSYDNLIRDQISKELSRNELNPKLGFIWKPNTSLSVRAASFKWVKPGNINNQSIQPVQIAGFNQFYDDFIGTVSWQHDAGLDLRLQEDMYAGLEFNLRNLRVPLITDYEYKVQEQLSRLYFNWKLNDHWVFNGQFKFEKYRNFSSEVSFPKFTETYYLPFDISYFSASGFFSTVKSTYIKQKFQQADRLNNEFLDHKSDFSIFDLALGYRFPKQYGLISLEVKNILNTNFSYLDRQYQMNEYYVPEIMPVRMIYSKLTLNF